MKILDIYQALDAKVNELTEKLKKDLDVKFYELELTRFLHESFSPLLQETINKILSDEQILIILCFIASQKGMCFSSYRYVNILLFTGIKVRVYSPYFYYERKKSLVAKREAEKKAII